MYFFKKNYIARTDSNFSQMYLKSCDFGSSVDEVIQQIKKQEAFEKILASQEEKVKSLYILYKERHGQISR